MQCPRCKSEPLKPTRLTPTLPAMGCAACGGVQLALLSYRHWAESQPAPETALPAPVPVPVPVAADSAKALFCPKCGRIMTKYRIDAEHGNRLDFCAGCDEVWLDGGEWQLLLDLRLAGQLSALFTEPWQLRVRREMGEQLRRERYLKLFGESEFAELERLRAWLADHPRRAEILAYLAQE